MKINLLISIFLIFLFKISSAQQYELINNTWNLEKVILNDIEHYFPNSINTINATANFTSNYFNSHICNTLSADTTLSNDLIIFNGSGLTLGSCPDSNNNEYNIFETYYFGQFFGSNTTSGIYPSYHYLIENIGNNLKLTLINPNGDNAIYWSENLSVSDSISNTIKVYPNPVEDMLTIVTEKYNKELFITIFDMQGKRVLNNVIKNSKEFNINLSKLISGTYLLNIKTENKNINTKILKK